MQAVSLHYFTSIRYLEPGIAVACGCHHPGARANRDEHGT